MVAVHAFPRVRKITEDVTARIPVDHIQQEGDCGASSAGGLIARVPPVAA